MKVQHYMEVEAKEYTGKAEGMMVRWLITKEDGAPNMAMRVVEVAKGGSQTEYDVHPWEHETFILEGQGVVIDEAGNEHTLSPGVFVYIDPNEKHQFKNTGENPLVFVCLIPSET